MRSTPERLGPFSLADFALDAFLVSGSIGIFAYYGLTFQAFAVWFILLGALVISRSDFTCHVIPDRLTVPGMLIGLTVSLFRDDLSLLAATIGGVVGFVTFYLFALTGEKLLKKPSLGGGDIKLAAMLGVFLGWQLLLLTIILASIGGLVFDIVRTIIGKGAIRDRIPFGPFLAYSALLSIILGWEILRVWMSILIS